MTQADMIKRLVDRQAIEDTIARYARGVDRRDWDLVRSTYHADATDDHGDYNGGVEGFIEWVAARHATIDLGRHFLGNMFIEFSDDDTALVETYFIALKRFRATAVTDASAAGGKGETQTDGAARSMLRERGLGPDDAIDVETFGRYIDRMDRRDDEWRVGKRIVAFDAVRITPALAMPGTQLKASWALSRRDGTDPLYEARREIGLD